MQNDNDNQPSIQKRIIPAAAQRALHEAEERRRLQPGLTLPLELGGRDGPEPCRFGDWEINGRTVDF